MNTLTRYQCEHCGKSFDDKDKCAVHEETHLLPIDLVVRSVMHDRKSPWPTEVTIVTRDGSGGAASFYLNYLMEDAE